MTRLPGFAAIACIVSFVCINCASTPQTVIENDQGESITTESLDACDDFGKHTLRLENAKEVIILVHGCKASSGSFLILKEVFESRGQQAIGFSYDYRDSIEECADRLVVAINAINELTHPTRITIVAHSQGGLVARRALISNRPNNLVLKGIATKIRLVTISSPFNGIRASSHCGMTALHIATAGATVLICQAVAGSTWSEINPSSDFIKSPGQLSELVVAHLKINTDERNTCREVDSEGNCLEDDFVFALDEQYAEAVDRDSRVINIELKAGHAQVVGKPGHPPFTLIDTLEENGVLREQTSLSYAEDVALLNRLYR
jgi:hypothetical protein